MEEKWYAVRTRSRHERVAADLLLRKSFQVFFPKISTWSRRKDRKLRITRPLFPGYLFIHFELTNDLWLEARKTHGVVDLVKTRKEPDPVPDEQILSVKSIMDSGVTFSSATYLNKGDRVIVHRGPLQGAVGIYVSANKKKGKLVVSIDLLNRAIEVEVDETDVETF